MTNINMEAITEKFIYKVNFKGKKRKKLECPPGYHPNADGTACVPMTASMKTHLKQGARKTKITKKGMGINYIKRVVKKTRRAMKFRKQTYGL
ncbi:putative prohead core protein [Acinetobacter phage SH-Ab 15599]|nr:putative prohead core protein [Acinetobacter phage SH-Ab 15599]